MRQFIYTITDPMGLHARPAGLFVKEAKRHPCAVTIGCSGRSADAKKILAVMSLAVKQGEQVSVTIAGDGEGPAADQIEAFMRNNL